MNGIGLDCGNTTVKLVLLSPTGELLWSKTAAHRGSAIPAARRLLGELLQWDSGVCGCPVVLTGSAGERLLEICPGLSNLGDIPAIHRGVILLAPEARSVIEIGSQSARFLTGFGSELPPQFAVNEHCAGGTGSFFEDQMSRLGLRIEDYSNLVAQAESIPRLSGRCAVFAKTDIIHRQQEGIPTPDILLGLCYAMVRNYKAVIVRSLPVERPVALCGGVAQNAGVVQAVKAVFGLEEEDLIIPDPFLHAAAVGAALAAQEAETCSMGELLASLCGQPAAADQLVRRSPLSQPAGVSLTDPASSGVIPLEGCALGIDVGSTSTDLVLMDPDGGLIDFQYLRTAGDPEGAVRRGLEHLRERFGELPLLAVGVTGSGRERIGRLIGADAVRDEITAQARAAVHWVPDADTVFEIGGQDSKYISLQGGQVADFQMNKICAAGTGSFVEEQAARMGIPLEEFGPLALTAQAPVELGERCTVFIETAIQSALAQGASQAEVAAGLCQSIVRNYLHKVVGSKPVGRRIVLQGGVAYNPGIVAAFRQEFGDRLTVSPCFSISGAFGAALLALETAEGPSRFHGFTGQGEESPALSPEVQRNIAFYQRGPQLLLEGYDPAPVPRRKTVGVPFALMIHKFFPMANAFFRHLGYNVLLSPPTNEEIIRLSQQTAQAETCYPVKLIHGHMAWLAEQGVDYIFLPSIHTMKHETSRVEHNYGCVYMQTAPRLAARALRLEERGITLLNPVFDLDFGQEAMASAMLGLGKQLGIPKVRCLPALMSGAQAVRRHTAAVEKQGRDLLASLGPEDKVLVLITRNYGLSDPVLNMGIPRLLLERGYKVLTLSHLPAHDLDLSADHPNLYWPFGQHILSGAKLVAHHPNLYAVYLTNHGCGPDTTLSYLFRQEMGDKPYLHIEVDEHFSPVGVITRIEAFLQSLESRPVRPLPEGFRLTAVPSHPTTVATAPDRARGPLYVPDLPPFTPYLLDYFHRAHGLDACAMPLGGRSLALGRAETSSKEYLPFPALLGGILDIVHREAGPFQALLPATQGAEADGQYPWAAEAVLRRRGLERVTLAAPVLERLPETALDPDLLLRAILTGDVLLCAPPDRRMELEPAHIPTWEELETLAQGIGALLPSGRALAAVGEPFTLFALHDGVLDTLEQEHWQLLRAPLGEYLWFLWRDAGSALAGLWAKRMASLGPLLGARNSFSPDLEALREEADRLLPGFAGANGRYRIAKALELGRRSSGVLTLAPRYENTAALLDMTGALEGIPHFHLAMDNDWDEGAWSRLNSFLYYLK
ncbi:MAG TPA: CoA-substrate-specific enzyme activase [Candidatus Flavonifractor intestinigallinarum]|uniref:CoA-substrate-specific enzyme activase n=1 Tax=Candidatus Flavonifractor intestinigallinarum TaxID=2838586 RepID=A0A9D2MJZ1_9FIRM|nr:CoA-substrate-specific enzyme activase [Candidatus Flavonifractor intestinigallinarum]